MGLVGGELMMMMRRIMMLIMIMILLMLFQLVSNPHQFDLMVMPSLRQHRGQPGGGAGGGN